MQVEIDDIGVETIQGLKFFVGEPLFNKDGSRIFFAALDEKRDRWLVLDDHFTVVTEGCVSVYTTADMRMLFRSLSNEGVGIMKAPHYTAYRYLLRAKKLPMDVEDGCTGCGVLWGDPATYGRCKNCSRCYKCCGKKDVIGSCTANGSPVNSG
jgi:hypothetical protein